MTDRARGQGQKPREEIGKGNQMTALRFQTGGWHHADTHGLSSGACSIRVVICVDFSSRIVQEFLFTGTFTTYSTRVSIYLRVCHVCTTVSIYLRDISPRIVREPFTTSSTRVSISLRELWPRIVQKFLFTGTFTLYSTEFLYIYVNFRLV